MKKSSAPESGFAEVDQLIRSAQLTSAKRAFFRLISISKSRDRLLALAKLARRLGLTETSLRLLYPMVRGKAFSRGATPEETAEYSVGLLREGAVLEAEQLLLMLNSSECPNLPLLLAFARMRVWDYAAAIPLIKKYLLEEEPGYERRVAEVNLAACLVAVEKSKEAEPLLRDLEVATLRDQQWLLHANVLELIAQNAMELEDFESASRFLAQATRSSNDWGSVDSLFIEKWSAILLLKQVGPKKPIREKLDEVRAKAKALHHWETLRDLDYHWAIASQDSDLLRKLYFGTPFESYRARILRTLKKMGEGLDDGYQPTLEPEKTGDHLLFQLDEGVLPFPKGRLLHRVFSALLSDYYRPQKLVELFSATHPEEHYNPTAPARLYDAIARLRRAFKENQIPLSIIETGGRYFLRPLTGFRVLVKVISATSPDDRVARKLDTFRKRAKSKIFRVTTFRRVTGLSERTASRYLSQGVQSGFIMRKGHGRSVSYSFTETS